MTTAGQHNEAPTCQSCGTTTPGGLVLCTRCVHITEMRLGDIPALVAEIDRTVSRQGRGGGSGHRKKGDDQPLPYDAGASAKRSIQQPWCGNCDEPTRHIPDGRRCPACYPIPLINVLVEWSDLIAQATGARPIPLRPALTDDLDRARAAVAIMLTNLRWFRTNPQAKDAHDAIWRIRDQLRSAIDRPPERLWAGPCNAAVAYTVEPDPQDPASYLIVDKPGRCELQLWRKWGEETITCDGWHDPLGLPGCGATYSIDERRDFLLASVEDQNLPLRLVWESLYELLPGCDVSWETARKWRIGRTIPALDKAGKPRTDKNGRPIMRRVPARLEPRGLTVLGVELFRGGDIITLARDEAPRRGRKRKRTRRGKENAS